MTRTRIALIATTSLVSMLGAALPAFAQAPAPAPMYAPAPAPAPMMAPAPAPESAAVMPVAPVMAPIAADDMTGSVGVGVGVIAGTDLLTIDGGNLMMKYWMSDAIAILPRLDLFMTHTKDAANTPWQFAPSVLADFILLKGASTRLDAGLGLGLALAKNMTAIDIGHRSPSFAGDPTATYLGVFVPVQIGVEHFFTRWFSMGAAANFDFLRFEKQGTPWQFSLEVSNVTFLGSLFIYTD